MAHIFKIKQILDSSHFDKVLTDAIREFEHLPWNQLSQEAQQKSEDHKRTISELLKTCAELDAKCKNLEVTVKQLRAELSKATSTPALSYDYDLTGSEALNALMEGKLVECVTDDKLIRVFYDTCVGFMQEAFDGNIPFEWNRTAQEAHWRIVE